MTPLWGQGWRPVNNGQGYCFVYKRNGCCQFAQAVIIGNVSPALTKELPIGVHHNL